MKKIQLRALLVGSFMLIGLAACTGGKSPYIELRGGGFMFNYRIAEATANLVVGTLKPLPEGSVIEVNFENPEGGAPIILKEAVRPDQTKFDFTTPPLKGIEKDKDYAVSIRLLDKAGQELQRIDKPFRSNLDQSILPEKPLVVGPVYTPNPELAPKPAAPN